MTDGGLPPLDCGKRLRCDLVAGHLGPCWSGQAEHFLGLVARCYAVRHGRAESVCWRAAGHDGATRTAMGGRGGATARNHGQKERASGELERAPQDLEEWIDVVLLAFDGAWRAGHAPEAIARALEAKQAKNEARTWPDWRTAEPGKAIEHVRGEGG